MHQGAGAVLVVLLPPSAGLAEGKTPATALPKTWAGVGAHAARLRLPLLFVSEGTARVANPDPAQPPPAFPTIPVDRDDALAIYRVVFECAQRARLGAGPSHLACVPRPRKGSADGSDALVRLETMLRARGAFGKSWRNGLERRLIRELTEA